MKINTCLRTTFPNRQIVNLAQSYHQAAEVLIAARANAIPIVNLQCHAIELFLKSLHLEDITTDSGTGTGVLLFTPSSGQNVGHYLVKSFDKAFKEHRDSLLEGMPSLKVYLEDLEGVFRKSRYAYEGPSSLHLGKAEDVSKFLAEELPKLHGLASLDKQT